MASTSERTSEVAAPRGIEPVQDGLAAPDEGIAEQIKDAEELNVTLKKLLAAAEHTAEPKQSTKFKTKTGDLKKRTFTMPPDANRAKPQQKHDYTHNDIKLMFIANETKSLVGRLEGIYGRSNKQPHAVRGLPCNCASTGLNRQKFHKKVAIENLRIYERLQRVKPSGTTAKKNLDQHWEGTKKYSNNCSRYHHKIPKVEAANDAKQQSQATEPIKVPTVAGSGAKGRADLADLNGDTLPVEEVIDTQDAGDQSLSREDPVTEK